MKDVFVVEALRWGDRENHSYVVGVFDNLHDACEACVVEELWRSGKYECVINDCNKMGIDIQGQKEELLGEHDVEEFNLEVQKRVDQYATNDWPEEDRIDIIGQNGNDGIHYE